MQNLKDKGQPSVAPGTFSFTRLRRHPVGLAAVLFSLLVAVTGVAVFFGVRNHAPQLTIEPNVNYIALVNIDGEQQTVPTNADTVGQLLAKLDVALGKNDRVEPSLDAPITGDNFLVHVYRAEPITVVDGTKTVDAVSAAGTVRGMVQQAGVQLYPEDYVSIGPSERFVADETLGHRIVVNRAVPIQVSLYSSPAVAMRTHAKSVGELIKSANITVTKDDTVKPAPNTPVSEGMRISIVRNGVQTVTVEEVVPPPVRTIIDPSLSFGSQAVRQEGSPGKQSKTFQITVENGEEVSRVVVQSVVTVQPVERIVAKGNTVNIPADKQAVMAAAGISPSDYGYVDYVFSRESRWNAAATNAGGCYGLGQACPGSKLVAACPNWQSDAVCQTKFFTGYANRYGGWAGAYNAWINKGWW